MLLACRKFSLILFSCALSQPLLAQAQLPHEIDLIQPQDYVLKRVSSSDPTGANADFRQVDPGAILTLLDVDGPGLLTHIWITVASPEAYHLKKLVLRIYWDQDNGTERRSSSRGFFWPRPGRIPSLGVRASLRRERQSFEFIFSHALSKACANHGFQ